MLCRARAIETQTYFLAPGQAGTHRITGERRMTYAHSLVCDPWGHVVPRHPMAWGIVSARFERAPDCPGQIADPLHAIQEASCTREGDAAPLPAELAELLSRVETATGGPLHLYGFHGSGVQPMLPRKRVVGTAVTVAIPGADSTFCITPQGCCAPAISSWSTVWVISGMPVGAVVSPLRPRPPVHSPAW